MTLDYQWKNHLLALDKIRNNINLRAYAGKDPFIEYKRESAELFQNMIYDIEEQSLIRISHAKLQEKASEEEILDKFTQSSRLGKKNHKYSSESAASSNHQKPKNIKNSDKGKWANIGRNEKCPCGSGLKYKHCCGKIT